jgi:hypothetical protein
MGKYLVVANVTAESPALRQEAAEIVARDPLAEFVVLVPVRPIPALLALVAGVDERPVALGRRRAQRARRRLESVGARCVSVRMGGYEPLRAVEDELAYERFDGVIVSTLPHPISHWLHLDLPGQLARRHPQLEVRHVVAPRELYLDNPPASSRLRYD